MFGLLKKKPLRGRILETYFPESFWAESTILDCGSGDGRYLIKYYIDKLSSPKQLLAVDKNAKNLHSLEILGVDTLQIDLEEESLLSTVNRKFNLITCSEVLEHLTDDCGMKLVHEFIALLHIDGHIFLSFPVNYEQPKNPGHITQPNLLKILKILLPLFHNFEMRKYNCRTYILFFLHKKEHNVQNSHTS